MKCLTTILKIIAIALNGIFLAGILLIFCSEYAGRPETLFDFVGFILIFGFPAVTLITLALTFHKKVQILHSILKIIAIIINVSFLAIFICMVAVSCIEGLVIWLVSIMGLGLPVVNVLAVALTFGKGKGNKG